MFIPFILMASTKNRPGPDATTTIIGRCGRSKKIQLQPYRKPSLPLSFWYQVRDLLSGWLTVIRLCQIGHRPETNTVPLRRMDGNFFTFTKGNGLSWSAARTERQVHRYATCYILINIDRPASKVARRPEALTNTCLCRYVYAAEMARLYIPLPVHACSVNGQIVAKRCTIIVASLLCWDGQIVLHSTDFMPALKMARLWRAVHIVVASALSSWRGPCFCWRWPDCPASTVPALLRWPDVANGCTSSVAKQCTIVVAALLCWRWPDCGETLCRAVHYLHSTPSLPN
jgi:hypothetical protein